MSRMLNIGFGLVLMATVQVSHASLVEVEDWFDSGSSTMGLLQASWDPEVYFAESLDVDFNASNDYEILDGYHLATWAEFNQREVFARAAGKNTRVYNHFDLGDWSGYNNRRGDFNWIFHFADAFEFGATISPYAHAGTYAYDTSISRHTTSLTQPWRNARFAGFVLIADAASVPEPSIIALMGLGLLGLGLSRRKLTK